MSNFTNILIIIRYFIIGMLLFPAVVLAQKTAITAKQAQEKFLENAYTHPDSARYYLHYLIRLDRHQPDSVIAKHYNNLGLLHGMNSHLDSAKIYYEKSIKIGSPRNRLGTMINLGVVYKKLREYDKALIILNKAVEGYKDRKDEKGIGTAYGELGSVYSVKQERVKAIEYLTKGIEITKRHKLSRTLAIQQQNLATIYYKSRNYEYAKEIFEECLPQLKASNDKISYAIALANYGSTLLFLGNTTTSDEVLKEAAILLDPFETDNIKAIVYGNIAAIAHKNGNTAAALRHYETSYSYILKSKSPESLSVISGYIGLLNAMETYDKALKIVNTIESTIDFRKTNEIEKLNFYNEASITLINSKQDQRGLKALHDVIALKDTVFEIENDQQLKEVEAKYQTQAQQQQTQRLKATNAKLSRNAEGLLFKYRYVSSAAIALIILLLLVWYSLRKKRHSIKVLDEKDKVRVKELEEERDRLKDKDYVIERQQQQLLSESLRNVNHAEQLKALVNDFKNRNEFGNASQIENLTDTLHWNQFIEKFNSLNPYFIQKLAAHYPQLNQSELQFCALVRVNLSYKEIANILQITHQSVFTKKYRITKKMAIEGDTDFLDLIRSL